MNEIWKPIVGFENLYEASNLGNIRSIQFHGKPKIKILTKFKDKLGYEFVKIRDWKNKYVRTYPVHRLVAITFIDNPDNKPYIDHIDINPSNNSITNLRWVTPLENQNNPITLERLRKSIISYNKSQAHRDSVTRTLGIPVLQLTMEGDIIAEFPSISIAAKELHTTACCIKRVCDGDRLHHRHYKFIYKK